MKNLFHIFKKNSIQHSYMEYLFENEDSNKDETKQISYLYSSRQIILNKIKPFDGKGIGYQSNKYVHVVIIGSDDLSLYLARQAALICHYPNFNEEEKEPNRTIISIINPQSNSWSDVENLKNNFERITGNLLTESIWSCYTSDKEWHSSKNKSFIDIEFKFIGLKQQELLLPIKNISNDGNAIVSIINNGYQLDKETESWLSTNTKHIYQYYLVTSDDLKQNQKINVRKAQIVNMLYNTGTHLKDICTSDIYEIKAYGTAISTFCFHTTDDKIQAYWEQLKDPMLKLSNVFCADCLATKQRSKTACGITNNQKIDGKILKRLANAEHTRWNVEKLILGYRTYNAEERYKDELLFANTNEMKAERNRMKKEEKAHIDICSSEELIRIDPDNFKYDCFLTLAIDYIMSRDKLSKKAKHHINIL